MALADFDSPADWSRDLDSRWPERVPMAQAVADTVTALAGDGRERCRLLELGVGAGDLLVQLADRLLTQNTAQLGRKDDAQWVAVDINPVLLTFVKARLSRFAQIALEQQDLREQWNVAPIPQFDVVLT